MRKWGIVITAVYALIVVGLLMPGAIFIMGGDNEKWAALSGSLRYLYGSGIFWLAVGMVVCGEAALLFLRVDTSWQRLRPRAHIAVSGAVAAGLTALLTASVIWCVGCAVRGDDFTNSLIL
jgi:hypothetical protein